MLRAEDPEEVKVPDTEKHVVWAQAVKEAHGHLWWRRAQGPRGASTSSGMSVQSTDSSGARTLVRLLKGWDVSGKGCLGCSDHVRELEGRRGCRGQRGWGCRSPGGAGSGGSVPGGLRKLSLFPRGPRPQVTCVSGAGWGVGETGAKGPLTALSASCLWTRQGIPGRDTILMCFTCPA